MGPTDTPSFWLQGRRVCVCSGFSGLPLVLCCFGDSAVSLLSNLYDSYLSFRIQLCSLFFHESFFEPLFGFYGSSVDLALSSLSCNEVRVLSCQQPMSSGMATSVLDFSFSQTHIAGLLHCLLITCTSNILPWFQTWEMPADQDSGALDHSLDNNARDHHSWHGSKAYCVPGTVLRVLCVMISFNSYNSPLRVETVTIPVFHMRKIKYGKIE